MSAELASLLVTTPFYSYMRNGLRAAVPAFTVDHEAKALYVYFVPADENVEIISTEEVVVKGLLINIDRGVAGEVLGVEILYP